jgi:hypothetical protein
MVFLGARAKWNTFCPAARFPRATSANYTKFSAYTLVWQLVERSTVTYNEPYVKAYETESVLRFGCHCAAGSSFYGRNAS